MYFNDFLYMTWQAIKDLQVLWGTNTWTTIALQMLPQFIILPNHINRKFYLKRDNVELKLGNKIADIPK